MNCRITEQLITPNMVQEQGAAGGGGGGGGGGGKKRNRNRNKNKNKGNNSNSGAKSNSQSHDDTPPPQETRQREGQDTTETREVTREVPREVVQREVTPPVETQNLQQQQQQQQNGGLIRDEAGLARNLARDYMPPAGWLELREAEKAFYERLAKGGVVKVQRGWVRECQSNCIPALNPLATQQKLLLV